jgi:DNA repair protein RadA/Sms
MPKTTITFVCRECGGESIRWAGQCPHCRAWNTLEEFTVRPAAARHAAAARASEGPSRPVPITDVEEDDEPRVRLDWEEVNRVLGGGFVKGGLTLVGGEPGVGKSTLLMHAALQITARGGTVLYASAEESARQVRMRAARLGALTPELLMFAENDVESIIGAIEQAQPALAVVDSIQTVYDPAVDSAPGSVTQVREATGRLMRAAKQTGVPIVLVGHVTKEGAIAGPRVLEHMVDTVLYLEGERRLDFRILRATKNRFGSTDEIGIFAMGESGLHEVEDPSAVLLAEMSKSAAGTAVVPVLEGSRPLLVEIQSLLSGVAGPGVPLRRTANGIDLNRVHMILAVVENRGKIALNQKDVFVNVAGGIRITETAADLGLALSVASNDKNVPLPDGTVVIGELGLAGEVRRVGQIERRLSEAARRGFTRAIIPRGAGDHPHRIADSAGAPDHGVAGPLRTFEVRDLAEAISAAFPAHMTSGANR